MKKKRKWIFVFIFLYSNNVAVAGTHKKNETRDYCDLIQ